MKTAISIPNAIFREAENFSKQRSINRSALYVKALQEYMSNHRTEDVTNRLNKIYSTTEATLDPLLKKLQKSSLSEDAW